MKARSISAIRLGLVLACLLAADAAEAEVRRIESVGAVGLREGDRKDPRQRAVQAGLREAVSRVASELLMDADFTGEGEPDVADLLGDNMVPYTSRFRIIEDRGMGPALFIEDPEVAREYVVVVAVDVEVDRIRNRLVAAGFLSAGSGGPGGGVGRAPRGVRLEVTGLRVYPAYEDLRSLLVDVLGASRALPLRFEQGHALLLVETRLSTASLVDRLVREAPPHMQVFPLGSGGDSAGISVRWTPPPRSEELPAVESRGLRGRRRVTSGGRD